MISLTISILGPLVIGPDPALRHRLPKKSGALLATLAIFGRPVTREKLADLLWPHQRRERSFHSLRNCLWQLRLALAPAVAATIAGDSSMCWLSGATLDIEKFGILAASKDIVGLQRAAGLYRGDLLDGLSITSEPWGEWIEIERERLRRMAADVFSRLAPLASAAGYHSTAISAARRAVALDPFSEPERQLLMRTLVSAGRRALALSEYRQCEQLLARELDVAPEVETRELADAIRIRGSAESATASRSTGQSAAQLAGQRIGRELRAAIAGRGKLKRSLVIEAIEILLDLADDRGPGSSDLVKPIAA